MSQHRGVAVVGSANADLVVRVDRRPSGGETIIGSDLAEFPGGKGANRAAAAARAGADVVFCACLGPDGNAELLRSSLAAAGVRLDGVARGARPTGTALILLTPDGENSIVVSPGANHELTVTVAEQMRPWWETAAVLVLELEIPLETVGYLAREASAAGVRVVLNAAPAHVLDPDVLTNCDVLIVNEYEARVVLGSDADSGSFDELADRLLAAGPRAVVITLGAAGSILADADGHLVVPAHRVEVLDTTGAGDAFVGAVAAELASGRSLRESVRFATAASALAVQRMGAQSSYADRAEVLAFLATATPSSSHS